MKIKAIVYPAEEGGYWAEVPALPDCFTDSETMEEVVAILYTPKNLTFLND